MHHINILKDTIQFVFTTALFTNAILFIPQTIKIFKEKDGREISLVTFGGFLLIQFTILLHGIIEHDFLLILGYAFSMLACGSVVIGALLFRKHNTTFELLHTDVGEMIKQFSGEIYCKDSTLKLVFSNHELADCVNIDVNNDATTDRQVLVDGITTVYNVPRCQYQI